MARGIVVSADAPLVLLALGHGLLLVAAPSVVVIALGLWWSSQTVAHYAVHRPFFASSSANRAFALYLTLLLGVPQTLWRERHLAHHVGKTHRFRAGRRFVEELLLLSAALLVGYAVSPTFLFAVWLPGVFVGLGLCWLQGHYEHARGTTSHYGPLYNFLFLNDGYHAEHHRRPGAPWSVLPALREEGTTESAWPPVIRWLDALSLAGLERMLFRFSWLRRFVVARHRGAFRAVLGPLSADARIGIVGGGLFPRTAIVLRELLPSARLVVIDCSRENLEASRRWLPSDVEVVHERFDRARCRGFDALVFPLALEDDRDALYRHPPARVIFVHDWLWRRRGRSALVSLLLLKRLNRCAR